MPIHKPNYFKTRTTLNLTVHKIKSNMRYFNLILILSLFFCVKSKAEIIEFYDYNGTHLAYELNTETKEAKVGIYNGFDDGNPHATGIAISWDDENDYTEYFKNLEIPNTIKYDDKIYTITAIGPYAFCEKIEIRNVKLPETIKRIEESAFYFCVYLETINIPSNTEIIGSSAFEPCKEMKITNFSKELKKIGTRAFFDCHSISEFTIPATCTEIGTDAFAWCIGLKKLQIEDGNTTLTFGYSYDLSWHYSGEDEAQFRGQFADSPIEELYLGRNIAFPIGTNKSYPPFTGISNYCTNTSGYQSEVGKTYKTLEFGDNVTILPDELFTNSAIKCDLVLPANIDSIGSSCFVKAIANEQIEITFPKTLRKAGTFSTLNVKAFKFIRCEGEIPPTGVNFAYRVAYVPPGAGDAYRKTNAWKDCAIIDPSDELITINVKTPGTLYSRLLAQDMQTSDVTRLKLKGNLNSDDWEIVKSMSSLYELDISELKLDILPKSYLVNHMYLTKITFPNTLTEISDSLFYNTNKYLNCEIILPQNCTHVGREAFSGTSIKGITYSNNIIIDENAFNNCDNLDTLYIHGNGTKVGKSAFWGSSVKKLIIGKGVEVADEAFYYNAQLKEVIFEDSVKSIGNSVFAQCKNFNKLTICGIVENVSDMKYEYLSEVNINDISKWAKYKFDKLESSPLFYGKLYVNGIEPTELIFDKDITSIGSYTFYNCKSIKKLNLPENCSEIGTAAFYGCTGLDTLLLPEGLKLIGAEAFYGCTGFKELKLPKTLKEIGSAAFSKCSNLGTVIAQWEEPFSVNTNTFSDVSTDCYLYVPILSASKYKIAGWTFPNLKEGGLMTITSNIGGKVEYNTNIISNASKEFIFTPYRSFYINFIPEDGYSIKRVKLNDENVTSLLEDNKLYIEEPEENMDISVAFADSSIEQGDVNGDKEINITDVVELSSYIIKSNPDNFYDYWGDMNNDDIINITDVILVINKILLKD